MMEEKIQFFRLYAERHPDYGRTEYGNYETRELAEEYREELMKRKVGKGKPQDDGYYESDWRIEEDEIIINKLCK